MSLSKVSAQVHRHQGETDALPAELWIQPKEGFGVPAHLRPPGGQHHEGCGPQEVPLVPRGDPVRNPGQHRPPATGPLVTLQDVYH